MASSGRGGNDPAWKYATPVEGNQNATTCIFCFATFKSGGITRLKSHLSGYDPHKSVKKCDKVPPEIKIEVIAWIKRKDSIKQEKAAVQDDIREELRNEYLGNQTSLYNDDDDNDDDDDGFQYPPDTHPAERQDYRAKRWYDVVPFNKADSPHFQNMLTATGNLGPGVKLPTSYEIQTRYLENEYTEMKRYVDTHRETWKIYGCTIMCDGWTSPTKMSILNFMVYSKGSTVFLKSVDASHMKRNAQYIELLLNEIIQDVGPENVFQIVTDNASAFKKARRELHKKYPLFWISCAAHCIDLIFEDIEKQETISTVVKWAQSVTNYIYNHGWVLAEMRSIMKGDLIQPGKTRFATNHIAIDSILKKKSDLRKLFTSSAWNENAASRTRDGKRIEKRVLDGTFWDGMEAVHKIYKPLYEILRIVDTEIQPTMPILYVVSRTFISEVETNHSSI
ncbi:uncharacterized protein LOC112199142 [Rosa chinensis]|uniref:uncharacterized protein LOC112199142 n=1 Tax=Rosa chinensis TaxID=74649 RepID=UPI001AD8AFD3|nr:uncharacterized protein LOC112199142 [Rosa chinensis]